MLRIEELSVSYDKVLAVDGVSFSIMPGEVFALVGESGCGKSTTGKAIVKLEKASAGNIFFDDVEISSLSESSFKNFRPLIQMIFQNPLASLNPKWTIGQSLLEPLLNFQKLNMAEAESLAKEWLEKVGLEAQMFSRYPHSFSGGQLQRVGIARALMVKPRLLICDEVVSALDVSVQTEILNLLQVLCKEQNVSMLFISHDLGVVRHISHRVGVMYFGKLVEVAASKELFSNPVHPYSRRLLASIPGQKKVRFIVSKKEEKYLTPDIWRKHPSGAKSWFSAGENHWVRSYEV